MQRAIRLQLVILALFLLFAMLLVAACGGEETVQPNLPGSPVPGTVPPTVFQQPAETGAVTAAEPSATVTGTAAVDEDEPAPTAAILAITLPDGKVQQMPVLKCEGVGAGENLDVLAYNTEDRSDPARIEVQVSGVHTGTGVIQNMYLAVTVGAENAWTFMGNTPDAVLTLLPNGSGTFHAVSIVNSAIDSTDYTYNQAYEFTGGWTCGE